MQKVVREIRDAQSELKRDVQATSQLMGSMISDSEGKFKESLTALLQELVQALKTHELEMKERVSKVEANLCSKITEQQQSLKGALDSHNISTETVTPIAVAALGRGKVPLNLQEGLIPLKLELFTHETLKTVEFLRQDVHRREKQPWVSVHTADWDTYDVMRHNVSQYPCICVTLNNAEKIFCAENELSIVANFVHRREMHIQITFYSSHPLEPWLFIYVDCVKAFGNSGFPFTKITVQADGRPFHEYGGQTNCATCSGKNIPHRIAKFKAEKEQLAKDGVIVDGELELLIKFQ